MTLIQPPCSVQELDRRAVVAGVGWATSPAVPSGVKLMRKVSQSFTKSTQSSFATCTEEPMITAPCHGLGSPAHSLASSPVGKKSLATHLLYTTGHKTTASGRPTKPPTDSNHLSSGSASAQVHPTLAHGFTLPWRT